jgi:hypothetical protein
MKRVVQIFGLVLLFQGLLTTSTAQDASRAKQENKDKIRIVRVTPNTPLVDGVENEFTVEIEYTLESADAATLMLGFNSEMQNRYRMTTNKKVKKGTNSITLKAKVVPKDWKEYGDFFILANLSPYPTPRGGWQPLTGTTEVIEFSN